MPEALAAAVLAIEVRINRSLDASAEWQRGMQEALAIVRNLQAHQQPPASSAATRA